MTKKILVALVGALLATSVHAAVITNAFGQVVTTTGSQGVTATIVVPAGTAASANAGLSAQSVTNGQAITLTADAVNVVSGIGYADGATVTCTLAQASASLVGKSLIVAVPHSATNGLSFAHSGFYVGPTKTLAIGQSMVLTVLSTNAISGP